MKPKRGQLFLLKSDSVDKKRPIVIVPHDILNNGHSVLAIPFYSQQLTKRKMQEWCVLFEAGEGNLIKTCVAKTDELTLIEKLDIDFANGPIGEFNDAQMQRLLNSVKWTLCIN